MKYYLGGKMSGVAEFNVPQLRTATNYLRAHRWDVLGAHEVLTIRPYLTREDYARQGLIAILQCGGLIVLDGWETSQGTSFEVHVATTLGMPVYVFHSNLQTMTDLQTGQDVAI